MRATRHSLLLFEVCCVIICDALCSVRAYASASFKYTSCAQPYVTLPMLPKQYHTVVQPSAPYISLGAKKATTPNYKHYLITCIFCDGPLASTRKREIV